MKKAIILIFALTLVVAFTGCSKKQAATDNEKGVQQEGAKQEIQKEEKGMISSIKDAMSLGKKMKCVYTVTQDGEVFQSEAFIDGEKYKSVTTFNNQSTHAVFDGEATYTWTDGSKQGMKMTKECMEGMAEDVEDIADDMEDQEDYHAEDPFENAVDVKCENVGSIDFSISSDVEFVDQCELIKNQEKQMEQMMKSLPQGVEIPQMQ